MKLTRIFEQEQLEFGWWVEIVTEHPHCIYYFGPFLSTQEAQEFLPGYVEDIEQEGVQEIHFQIKQDQPKKLTIFDEEWEDTNLRKNSDFTCYLEEGFLEHKDF
jgi:hypothetical protein